MEKTEIFLTVLAILLLFKLVKELMYIRLYSFIIKLQSEGKLIPENDPNGVAESIKKRLEKNRSKFF